MLFCLLHTQFAFSGHQMVSWLLVNCDIFHCGHISHTCDRICQIKGSFSRRGLSYCTNLVHDNATAIASMLKTDAADNDDAAADDEIVGGDDAADDADDDGVGGGDERGENCRNSSGNSGAGILTQAIAFTFIIMDLEMMMVVMMVVVIIMDLEMVMVVMMMMMVVMMMMTNNSALTAGGKV